MENNQNEQTTKQEPTDLDKAAYDLEFVMPKALSIAANMKAGELNRVFSMLLQYPIVKNPKRFKSQKETELFLTCLRLMNAKSKVLEALKPQLEDVQDAAVDGVKEELLENMMKGKTDETNG